MFDARERDLQRYYQPWLDAQNLINSADGRAKGLTYEGYKPQMSRDKSLTAFAQLAALRLGVRRAMVSLIDSSRQYILAEATKTLSLLSHNADRPEDEVWLGNTIIARYDAVCHLTFASTYTASDDNGETCTFDALIIPDCRLDPRLADKDYVKGEPGVRFYAGVPITTRAGHRIGVYAVSDEKPRKGLSVADVRFMEHVAAAVMEHLELAKDSDDRSKGERMVRGLTDFIERSSLNECRHEFSRQSTMDKQTENARLDDVANGTLAPPARQLQRKREGDRESDVSRVFHRAARIIRQSTEADGIVIFDTSAAGIQGHVYENYSPPGSSDESQNQTTDFDTADSTASRKKKARDFTFRPSAGGAETPNINGRSIDDSKPCPVVALSLAGQSGLTPNDFVFTEAAMERYILRYPFGKFFNFNEEGVGFNSSDEKSERSETDQSDNRATPAMAAKPPRPRKKKDRFTPSELLQVLPNVRSLIFLPLWDPASERWIAGAFLWTSVAGRLMSPENELPYLKAFGNSITSEIARVSAQKADRAKTTFIASISHELRSPLHGILGSVEFLQDTVHSPYQESLVSSIETCGRTLLDTIDHVLDYAKINKLRDASSRRRNRNEGRQKKLPADNSILGVTTDFNLAQLIEEVCETVCAGHNFRKTHSSSNGAFHDHADTSTSAGAESEGGTISEGVPTAGDWVMVTLKVAPFVNWMVRSQPGAVRRIIMNLLGNSLKYTASGFISISLLQGVGHPNFVDFQICVEDSGKGMSPEYQRTKMFAPFSQEDPFSSGTGLGLSIVKQIVESLKGQIEVKSTLNMGTKACVSLRLPSGESMNARAAQLLIQAPEALKKKTAAIILPPDSLSGGGAKLKESIQQACVSFDIAISEDFDLSKSQPDFLFTEPVSLDLILTTHAPKSPPYTRPLCVVCFCTDLSDKSAVESRINRQFAALGWVSEVVTQPCGPRKLARALLDSQSKASQADKDRFLTRSLSTQPQPTEERTLVYRSMSDIVPEHNAATSTQPTTRSPLLAPSLPAPTSPLTPPTQLTEMGSKTPQEYGNTPPRVLLVDDNAINLKLLVVFSKRQNLQYTEAVNGLEAFNYFKKGATAGGVRYPVKPFDFVLMDLSMPVMDGLESTRQIRQYETENDIPRCTIIALTGLASAQDQQDAVDAGVDMYLVKPVKFGDIKRVFGVR